MSNDSKSVMIFDPAISGHHYEYISHIISYISENNTQDHYFFVLNPEFAQSFPDILAIASQNNTIDVTGITNTEFDLIFSAGSLGKRSFNEFRIMNSYASKFKIDHAVLLYLNGFQLALGFKKVNYTISGILFGQYTWQNFEKSFKGRLYKQRKKTQTQWMLRNKKLKCIFLLNDEQSCILLNKRYKTNRFKHLPDPVSDSKPEKGFNLREKYHIPAGHPIFLHIGSLEPRKGTVEIIESLEYLNDKIRNSIYVMIMGKVWMPFDELLTQKMAGVKAKYNAKIIYEPGYISDSRLKSIFEQVDFILIPYKNTEASSGILGHAIINKKPLIGPRQGLLGQLIEQHCVAYQLDTIGPASIAEALAEFYYAPPPAYDENMRTAYLNKHSGYNFAKTILDQIDISK
jgi:glycosyltransferase involved in cell wall biosynthesis